ncbi:hypothetical protein K9N68_30145 [Kovacikia minuta CCNUW1]|uniref:hypothetical protein n=1 Tax=Kovacikia minuta TaxID=2931930 RepID=UPI001CCC093A|nr:hypothetical protein [Kovacikia minuta]UBF25764.1 hypothetical protein K9N68_30145 [Kovacikia minuta CCNUW1]
MRSRAIPWVWLFISFLSYGIIGFSSAALLLIVSVPFVVFFPVSLILASLVALVLSFAAPWGTALAISFGIALSAGLVLLATYFWDYVLYFWSQSVYKILYWGGLAIWVGVVWFGISTLVHARHELIKSFRKSQTFLILASTSLSGLIIGWLIGRSVFP